MVLIPTRSIPYDDYVAGKRVQMIEIHYTGTDPDIEGVLRMPLAGATTESIAAAIRAHAAPLVGLIGKPIGGK